MRPLGVSIVTGRGTGASFLAESLGTRPSGGNDGDDDAKQDQNQSDPSAIGFEELECPLVAGDGDDEPQNREKHRPRYKQPSILK